MKLANIVFLCALGLAGARKCYLCPAMLKEYVINKNCKEPLACFNETSYCGTLSATVAEYGEVKLPVCLPAAIGACTNTQWMITELENFGFKNISSSRCVGECYYNLCNSASLTHYQMYIFLIYVMPDIVGGAFN